MSKCRFEEIRSKFHHAFFDLSKNDSTVEETYDPWFPVSKLINDLNENRRRLVASSSTKLLDETMSAWKPRKDKTGGLPNISFIQRKPEPLGTEFKAQHLLFRHRYYDKIGIATWQT